MKLIGVVASGSTTTYAPLIVYEEAEKYAKEEQLIIIDDSWRNIKFLGILRNVKRYEPFLSVYRRTSFVDNPSLVESGTLPHTGAYISIIGTFKDSKLESVELPPNPGSKVYVVESKEDLKVNLGKGLVVGVHKYSSVEIPLTPESIPFHVAVVGATGTGKSRLVKALIDEILSKTGYKVIVFDHAGVDYAPYYRNYVVQASKIVLDVSVISDLILERTGLDRRTYEQYILLSTLWYAFDKVFPSLSEEEIEKLGVAELKKSFTHNVLSKLVGLINYGELTRLMAKYPIEWRSSEYRNYALKVIDILKGRESAKVRLGISLDVRLGEGFFKSLSRRNVLPSDIVNLALKQKLVVIDLSMEDSIVKKYVVSTVINEVWKKVEEKQEPVNIVAVVDEAHNYACRYCGEPHKAITRTSREGRKWGFGLILATQRAIDIDPEIRGNINTWFFSKLQTPSDFNEISAFMNLAGISESSLAILEKREFYVAGLMNPLKIPVLIKVKEVPSPR